LKGGGGEKRLLKPGCVIKRGREGRRAVANGTRGEGCHRKKRGYGDLLPSKKKKSAVLILSRKERGGQHRWKGSSCFSERKGGKDP